jgi:Tfp pilus assembly protein PilX
MNTHNNERGMAIVIALFLMAILTALGTSLMFLSQTETYATMNYRMMSQARYAAEAGVQKASNFLLDPVQYSVPPASVAVLFDNTKSPVVCISGCPNSDPNNPNHWVILSATTSTQPSNYPVAAVQTAFNDAFHTGANGKLTAGNATLTYTAFAKLQSIQRFDSYGGAPQVIQTWEITSTGGLGANHNATVEVVALVETPKIPANTYAAFATNDTCGALDFQGNVEINSYDSTNMTGAAAPTLDASGGNVGTNGNLSLGGSANVDGNLYTPRTGVGTCASGNVDAFTGTLSHVDSIVRLPAVVVYPTPPVPAWSTTADTGNITSTTNACTSLFGGAPPGSVTCDDTSVANTIKIDGHGSIVSLPQVRLGGGANIVLVASSPPAQYNFNSIKLDGGASLGISATGPTQGVLVNVVGKDNTGAVLTAPNLPIDFVGGTYSAPVGCAATCSNFDASMLQFIYAGSTEIDLRGNSAAAATFYAPNAPVVFNGTTDLYGSVLGRTINNVGSASLHYDRRLMHDFYVAGHPMVGTFSWKRY